MNAQRISTIAARVYVGFSILSLAYVALLSLYSPQATMDLVGTTLPNTDALSSIRGIYGGVGMVIVISLIYALFKDLSKGVIFLTLFWFSYAFSRLTTMWVDGPLGDFGSQWLMIEAVFAALGLVLWLLNERSSKKVSLSV